MKNLKKNLLLVCLVGVLIIFLCYSYFIQSGKLFEQKKPLEQTVVKQISQTPTGISEQKTLELNAVNDDINYISKVSPNNSQKASAIKQYDDDWCIANIELSESDYSFSKQQVNDWDEFQGKARSRGIYAEDNSNYEELFINEDIYPNNSLIRSYEVLPIEQLESLAIAENKWAMVAFVQNDRAEQAVKDEIAKKLIVKGASYYALEHLVLSNLAAAKTSYRRVGAVQETLEYITEAYKYAYWGLKEYNLGGLGPFMSNISTEFFTSNFPIKLVLPTLEKEIKASYEELAHWVDKERKQQNIVMPDVPKAVKNNFAMYLALRQNRYNEEMETISNLNISSINPLSNVPCVNEYLADFMSKLE